MMQPRCPEHGVFLALVDAFDIEEDPWDCYQWWVCPIGNDEHIGLDGMAPIPAPQYQWLWECCGIPFEDLLDWPELLAEYTEMWNAMPKSYRQKYKRYSPANVIAATPEQQEVMKGE